MAHELVFWRGGAMEAPAEVWDRLLAGRPVADVAPLGRAQVRAAFDAEFSGELSFEEHAIFGPGFELQVLDGARYLLLACAADAPLERLARVRDRLGCSAYDPHTRRLARPPAVDAAPVAPSLQAGAAVHHGKFGAGRVLAVDGEKLTVRFDDGRERRLLASFVVPSSTHA